MLYSDKTSFYSAWFSNFAAHTSLMRCTAYICNLHHFCKQLLCRWLPVHLLSLSYAYCWVFNLFPYPGNCCTGQDVALSKMLLCIIQQFQSWKPIWLIVVCLDLLNPHCFRWYINNSYWWTHHCDHALWSLVPKQCNSHQKSWPWSKVMILSPCNLVAINYFDQLSWSISQLIVLINYLINRHNQLSRSVIWIGFDHHRNQLYW